MLKKLNAGRNLPKPKLVRNVKTGALAEFVPDSTQPTLPKGWVPVNASRRPARVNHSIARLNSSVDPRDNWTRRGPNEAEVHELAQQLRMPDDAIYSAYDYWMRHSGGAAYDEEDENYGSWEMFVTVMRDAINGDAWSQNQIPVIWH